MALAIGWLSIAVQAAPPVVTLPTTPLAAPSQSTTAQESRVKAAYLVKFTQYTTWPAAAFASDNAPLIIGIIGSGALNTDLEQESRPIAKPRPIEIRQVTTPEEAARCHAVFFSRADNRIEEAWLLALRNSPVLTVGESDRTIERGAVIRLVTEGKSIRFEVSRPAMESTGLKISSDMLRYAKTVHNKPEAPR
jgi:hypothetical protein